MTVNEEQTLVTIKILREGAHQEAISRNMKVEPEFVTRLCDSLIGAGYLSKADRGIYALTPRGEKALEPVTGNKRQVLRAILEGLTDKEQISSIMGVSARFVARLCDSLVEGGYMSETAEGGYILTPRGEKVLKRSTGVYLLDTG